MTTCSDTEGASSTGNGRGAVAKDSLGQAGEVSRLGSSQKAGLDKGCTMIDTDKSKEQLIEELAEMRRRVAEVEASEGKRIRSEDARGEWEQRHTTLRLL